MGWFSREPKISGSMVVGITETGKREAEQFTSHGSRFAVLAALSERSPQTIGDLSRDADVEFHELRALIKLLQKQGLIRLMETGR